MRVAFGAVDITPGLGAHKPGWLRDIVVDTVLDPIFARVAVFADGAAPVALVQLDTLSIRWSTVDALRRRLRETYGFPGERVLVAATHNHCGGPIANCGEVPRDDAYLAGLVDKVVGLFGELLGNLAEAELGFGRTHEFGLSHNRRVALRDGRTVTHGTFSHPDALYYEGPIDPEVGVLAARGLDGRLLGVVVNFACHPTHHGGTSAITAGYPGALARALAADGIPSVFLNGACGNLSSGVPACGLSPSLEEMGKTLADDVRRVLEQLSFGGSWPLAAASATLALPYRRFTEAEVAGTIPGAQRFIDSAIYDRGMPALLDRIRRRRLQPAEIQAFRIGQVAYAGFPAEYFVQFGLRIKQATYPLATQVVGHANGMVGYVPTLEAFARGGYETTFAGSSRMAPECGDLMADAAIDLLRPWAAAV